MCRLRLTTTVLAMTMNWYAAEILVADRNRELAEKQNRRWPALRHARMVRAGRRARPTSQPAAEVTGTGLVPDRAVARR